MVVLVVYRNITESLSAHVLIIAFAGKTTGNQPCLAGKSTTKVTSFDDVFIETCTYSGFSIATFAFQAVHMGTYSKL